MAIVVDGPEEFHQGLAMDGVADLEECESVCEIKEQKRKNMRASQVRSLRTQAKRADKQVYLTQ